MTFTIIKYGIAFCEKECMVFFAKLRLQRILLDANSGNPQAIEQIMNMSTNLPWYKCWCKDGTEFYNNMSQIERDYISLFPNKLLDEYSVYIMQLFRTFSAGHPEIRCSDSGCQCSPL